MGKAKQGFYYEFGELSQYIREIAHSYFLSRYHLKSITKIQDVEDLTNSVFLTFAEQYHEIENLGYWLRRVLFVSFVRMHKKNKIKMLFSLSGVAQNRGSNIKAQKEKISDIIKILSTFSEDKQKIVRLKIWGNLSFQIIAENLKKNITETSKIFTVTLLTIKNRLR